LSSIGLSAIHKYRNLADRLGIFHAIFSQTVLERIFPFRAQQKKRDRETITPSTGFVMRPMQETHR